MTSNNVTLQNSFLSRLKSDLEDFKSKTDDYSASYITSMLTELEAEMKIVRERHLKITVTRSTEATKYIDDDAFRQIRKCYHELWAVLHDLLPQSHSQSTKHEEISLNTTMLPQCHAYDLKLPKIDIPHFSGDYDEWMNFINLFTALVHNNTTLEPIQKLQYLQTSLKGEASNIIKNLELNNQNYDEARKLLKERYQNTRRLVNSYFKRIFKSPSITQESSKNYKALVDNLKDCTASLKRLGVTISDYVIIFHIIDMLPFATVKDWEESLGASTELPSLDAFFTFLETKFRILEVTESLNKSSKKPQKAFHVRNTKSNKSEKNFKTNVSKSTRNQSSLHNKQKNIKCLLCNGEHFVHKCDAYSRMSQSERFNHVKNSWKLCINCLSNKHSESQCNSKYRCRVCDRKHHTTLHRFENPNRSNSSESSAFNNNQSLQPSQQSCNVAFQKSYHVQSTAKLLGTATVQASNPSGFSMIIRALVDPCSTDNYISTSTVNSLRLKKYYDPTEVSTMGNEDSKQCDFRVNIRIKSLIGDFSTEISAAVIDQITTDMPSTEIPIETFGHLVNLPLGDPFFNQSCSINILLGVDIHTLIKLDESVKYGNLIAENSRFGYLIRGSANDKTLRQSKVMMTQNSTYDLNKQIQKFWETEELITEKPKNPEEVLCESIFQSSLKRGSDGHFTVNLPFKNNQEPSIGQSRFMAVRRFLSLEKKLEGNSNLKAEYHKQIMEYIQSNHLIKATNSPDVGKQFYLPHHAVIKDSSSTTRVRIVFDASCKSSDGSSLNDHLMTGPKLQTDIRDILFSWRQFPIPLTADIEKMYRMFGVNPIHQDYQRIVWRFDPTQPLEDWKLTTITFGTSSAPYQAIRILHHIADECKEIYPLASKVIKSHFYVDDCLAGGYTIQGTVALKSQLLKVLQPYGLHLRKWNSSCKQVLDQISPDLLDKSNELTFDETQYSKTLGVCWSKSQDSFHFNIDLSKYSVDSFTKREVLSLIARLYDPLGFVSPCTMLSKQVMQRIWQTSSGWDEKVEENISKDFSNFLSELHLLRKIKIPRWINLTDATSDVTIFGFCDASLKGYGAVIYLLNPMPSDPRQKLILLSSKTKVADLKYESIARLELNGAVLLAELIHWAVEQFQPRKSKVFAFCDSQIVLAWLRSNPAKWKTYVANRATQILNFVNKEDWYYVDTKNNPADFASRGLLPSEIVNNDMWWVGPDLSNLHLDQDLNLTTEEETVINESVNRNSIVLHTRSEEPLIITKYSNHSTMLRKTKYLTIFPLRVLQKILSKSNLHSPTLSNVNIQLSNRDLENIVGNKNQSPTPHNLNSSTTLLVNDSKTRRLSELVLRLSIPENTIFRLMQQSTFAEEIKALTSNQQLSKNSKLKGLFPFLDKFGVLRVGGRLQNADLTFSQKHPIILASNHQVTKNLINAAHERTLHGTEELTIAYLRNRYHIPRISEAVKNFIHRCNQCFRFAKQQQSQLMGTLPSYRVQFERAFQNSGVDYAGPMTIKAYPGRCKKFLKCYVAVFVCLGSKALHLELVSDLTSNAFLAAFRRFTSRRGRCHNLYSDNGTNFVGAARILDEDVRKAETTWKSDLEIDLESMGTIWHFIPPATPNFGGLWEAGVKAIKNHLKKTVGTSFLTYEELSTILIQIEGVLNSRPLCPMSNNPNNYSVLTPAHFLIGEAIVAPVEPIYDAHSKPPLNRWNHLQFTFQRCIRLWKRDYLQTLHNRPKNQFATENLAVNDLVLLIEDNMPATIWPTVIVDTLHPGHDGLVRVVTVRTSSGKTFKRPISKLRKLPCNEPFSKESSLNIQNSQTSN